MRVQGVLPLHDFVVDVQKRLGNYTGECGCRLCGTFLDSQLEHEETYSNAEATRGDCACARALFGGLKLADSGVTTEPQRLTETTSRPADIFTTAAVPERSAALDVCVWHPSLQQQAEEMQHKLLFEHKHFTEEQFQTYEPKGSCNAPWSGQPTTPCRHTNLAVGRRHGVIP